MKRLVIVAVMAVAVTAYKQRRNSALEDFPPYPEGRQGIPFHEQHQPFREAAFRPRQYQSYRHRPYRQDLSSYREQLSFRDQSLLRDYSSPGARPFYGDGPYRRDSPKFRRQPSFLSDGPPPFKDPTNDKNEQILRDQALNDQYSYQRPSFRDDFRFADLYDKPISSYREQQLENFAKQSDYLRYGNHGLGYISVPSPYGDALPLNEGTSTSTTPSMISTSTHEPFQQSTVSSVGSAITQVHTSVTSEPKMASLKASHTVTMPTVKSDTLAEDNNSTSSPPMSTKSAMSVTAEQSSNLAHPQQTTTTEASLSVMATESPILSFGRQTLPPLEFQSSKLESALSYYFPSGPKNKLQQSLLSYLLSQQAKNALKINEESSLSSYVSPEVLSNSLDNKIPGSELNYVVPVESKDGLKGNLQSSLLNYLLQRESNRGLSFQQSAPTTETMNYVSLAALAEKPKLSLPTLPIATLSAVSRPLQTFNYLPMTLPRASTFVAQDSSVSSFLPLASTSLPTSLSSSISDGQTAGVFNSLPGGISGGITAGIPANLASTVPANIPTLNFAQNFQHVDHTRQFEPARSLSTGLQLQLGGFGGIDYTLRSPNPAPRPLELGIAKVGLSLPELPRQQLSTLSKVPLGHQFW